MLSKLVSRSKVVIFEVPARKVRYGEYASSVDFLDNDEESVVAYYDSWLNETCGEIASRIELLGKSRVVGEREPFRWLYAI